MDFQVRSSVAELSNIYPGQIISYTVKPFAGTTVRWTTEITHVQDHLYFIDEQRVGPYKLWHPQHHFHKVADGVLMKDIVHYSLPMGVVGSIARKLFVAKQLDEIFEYRKEAVSELFNPS